MPDVHIEQTLSMLREAMAKAEKWELYTSHVLPADGQPEKFVYRIEVQPKAEG